MAYLRDIRKECANPACIKPATVEVLNRFNAPCGFYCAPHGKQKLAALLRAEKAEAEDAELQQLGI